MHWINESLNGIALSSPQLGYRIGANVLTTVLQTALQIGQVAQDTALVHNTAANALGHLHLVHLVVVVTRHGRTLGIAPLHGLQGAHAPVLLQTNAIGEEVFAGCLGCARQQGAHHHSTGSQGQGLNNMTDGLDAAVGYHRYSELTSIGAHLVDGRGLGAAAGHHLLGDANGAGAHAHPQSVHAGIDEVLGLGPSHH